MAYYRNLETGIIQKHPVSGLAKDFNSEEVGEDGKPVKPYVPLGASADEMRRRTKLVKGDGTPDATGGVKTETPEATTGTGSANTEGDQ